MSTCYRDAITSVEIEDDFLTELEAVTTDLLTELGFDVPRRTLAEITPSWIRSRSGAF
jgi:hypothetical protein